MTPDQADIAFVLETVPGIIAVYAVEPRGLVPAAEEIHVVVHIEDDQRALAAAHYALLRILDYEERARVLFTRFGTTSMHVRATPMVLSGPERFAAMSRVSARAKALAEERAESAAAEERERDAARGRLVEPVPGPRVSSALVVDEDATVATAVREAFPAAEVVVAWPVRKAVAVARARPLDLVLCRAAAAFGLFGFIEQLADYRPRLAQEVIIVAQPGERLLMVSNLEATKRRNRCLLKPLTAESIRLLQTAPLGFEVLNVPAVAAASSAPAAASSVTANKPAATPREYARRALVLVVDDEPDTAALAAAASSTVHVIRTSDEWVALEKIALNDLDLVLCNASMKVAGDKPLYRLLWNTRPDIKSRFVLIIDPRRVPASVRDGRTRGAVSRPITLDTIAGLLAAVPAR